MVNLQVLNSGCVASSLFVGFSVRISVYLLRAIGIRLAMAAGKGLESSLYGMKPLDMASYMFAIGGVALVALLASVVPAGRAANVDLLSALRLE